MIVRHLLAIFVLIGSTQGAAPEISNLPASIDIIESKAASTTDILFTLTASDPDNDTFTCTVQSTAPPVSAFLIIDDSGTFNFYLNNNPPFDFDANPVYTVTVACTDSNSETGTGDITVNLTPNPSPDISGLPAGVSVSETAALGFKVYDVTVTDTDSFTCVIDAQSPTADTFSISNPTNYEIHLDKALDAATNPVHTIDIKCSDSWGFTTKTLTVAVTANTPPVFTGYPAAVPVMESATGGSAIHTIAVTDTDSFSCAISASPVTPAFDLDPATNKINLITGHNLHYATQNTYVITVTCTDAKGSSTVVLTVNVQQNTRPVITPFSTVTVSETQTAKLKLRDVTVTETDPYTCDIPVSTEFSIEPTGGTPAYEVYLNANPGLNFATTSSYTIAVTCSDAWGSDTESITVSVTQNAAPSMSGFPASVSIIESDAGGNGIYTIVVTDTDTFACFGGTGPFSVQKVGSDWVVFMSTTHSLDADVASTYTVTVTCTDAGSKSSTGDVTINVQNNTPPDIQSLPVSGTVSDTETAKRLLHTLVIVETDAYTCTKTGTGPFSLLEDSGAWKLYLDANPNFNPTTASYALTITCADAWGSTSGTATITMVANAFPVIDGLPTSVSINEADAGGTSIYTVTVSDVESDAISCTIDSIIPTSAASAFTMVKPLAVYEVQLVAGHSLRQATTPSVLITIRCTDGNANYGNLTVVVQPNAPPDIQSLPAAATFIAGTTPKTKIHDLVVVDAEGDLYMCIMTASPSGPFAFEYTGTAYEVYINNNPTFTASTYNIDVNCKDDYGSSNKSLTLTITPNTDPVITGMPVTVAVVETETAVRTLHTIAITDAESQTITCTLVSVPPGPFSINQKPATPLYEVELNADAIDTLDGVTNPDHTVTVTCEDSAGGTTSADVLVTVTPNMAPTVDALPGHIEVGENQVVELPIWTLAYTDAETDTVTCDISSNPAGGPFDLREDGLGTPNAYKLWVQSNPNFNYTGIPSYQVTFTCTDHYSGRTGRSSNNTLTVDILKNRPPVFTTTNTITQNAQATPVGTSIHTCIATDADMDIVTYSVTISPTTDSFDFNPVTCELKAAKDLKKELTSVYTATITADDGKITTVQNLGITLTNVNTAPVLTSTGLNQVTKVYFDETTATNTLLYTPVVYDPDAGQTQTITYTVFPAGEVDMFDVSTTAIRLKNGKVFDYEQISFYKLTMYVTDDCATTGPYYLEVRVNNIPEVCGFDKTVYETSTTEAGQGGGRMAIGFTISDADDPDYHTFSLVNNPHSQYFEIGQYTGEISFKTNYDIDTCGFAHPRNATIIVQCNDQYGETGTATVSIYVEDYNDNAPYFPNGGEVMIVTQYTQPGAYIGTLSATDCDYGINADLEYSGVSAAGSPYYTIAANGNVYLTKDIDFEYGTDHTFLVKAKDHGTPQLTGSTYLTIIYRWTSTTTTTTVAPVTVTNWWDKPENIALVACLALLALFLLGLLAYLCCLRRIPCGAPCKGLPSCKKCCKPPKPAKKIVTPKNPKKEPFKFFDHNDLNVKREMFSTKQQAGDVIIPMKL